ncbi:NmrA family transcriptional regulator [Kineosporia sp. NBRC 101731]|nr:NmrA family transcriptional regulator [Kineosporia sp. NBRC 101731]
MSISRPVLVLGATGKTGRRVAERLRAQGVPVRRGSRSAATPFDWDRRETWEAAVSGVQAVYISYFPDLAFPGATATVQDFAARAAASGVQRLVLLSGRGEEAARAAERSVAAAGVEWNIVRSAFFDQNFSESFFLESVLEGEIVLPTGQAAEPFVDADDIADTAVVALTGPRTGQIYEVTGPRLLTFAQVAEELSAATGRTITYVQVTGDEYRAALAAQGLPEDFADLFTSITDGRNAYLCDGVQTATGRPPRDFTEYARLTAATGIWNT